MIGLVLGLDRLLDLKFFVFLRITEIYKEKLSKKEIGDVNHDPEKSSDQAITGLIPEIF
jgi:hypothetical protein